jgi:hypothetical protein
MKTNWIIVTKGGPIKGIRVESFQISDEDEEFLEEGFEDFKEYEDWVLEETRAAEEQRGISVTLIEKEKLGEFISGLSDPILRDTLKKIK